jgi:biopolymer transport protein ExbD
MIILVVAILLTAGSTHVNTRELAQQREGEVLQQLERDRQQQELQKKEKERKKPPVIIKEDKKGPTRDKAKEGQCREKETQD